MVNRPTGGVKNQLSSRKPPTAASSAGSSPPISATRTVTRQEEQHVQRQLVGVVQQEQHDGEQHREQHARATQPGDLAAPAERRERPRGRPGRATCSWVTRWTSIEPASDGDPVARRTR